MRSASRTGPRRSSVRTRASSSTKAKGLAVVVAAEFQPAHAVLHLVARGQEQHRGVLALAQALSTSQPLRPGSITSRMTVS